MSHGSAAFCTRDKTNRNTGASNHFLSEWQTQSGASQHVIQPLCQFMQRLLCAIPLAFHVENFHFGMRRFGILHTRPTHHVRLAGKNVNVPHKQVLHPFHLPPARFGSEAKFYSVGAASFERRPDGSPGSGIDRHQASETALVHATFQQPID